MMNYYMSNNMLDDIKRKVESVHPMNYTLHYCGLIPYKKKLCERCG